MVKALNDGMAYAAAHLYYEKQLTQEKIAYDLGVSRPTVSKLLSHAQNEGIVEITVRTPGWRNFELEGDLVERFGLDNAVVVPASNQGGLTRQILLAAGALELLKKYPHKMKYVGLGWGRSVFAFIEAIEHSGLLFDTTVELLPLIGGSGQTLEVFQLNEMVRRAAQALGARASLLHVPALVSDDRVRTMLLEEPSIKAISESWNRLDVAIVGVGRPPDPSLGPLYEADYLKDETLTAVAVAVGDVCAHYFDIKGKPAAEEYDSKLLAISRDDLRKTSLSIGMAAGQEKVAGIFGAVQAQLINVLVTDAQTASMCLRMAKIA